MELNPGESENIEALRRWWHENGKFLLGGVAALAVAYGGWSFWDSSRVATVVSASDMYQQIVELTLDDSGTVRDDIDRDAILAIAEQLRAEYPGQRYARYGALFAAQQLVALDDLEGATEALQWIIDTESGGLFATPDDGLVHTARLRLARVLLARDETERARELVEGVAPGAFEGAYAELRGDIMASAGQPREAREYYQAAQDAGSNSEALRLKLAAVRVEELAAVTAEDSGLGEDGGAGAGEDSGLGEDGDAGAGEDSGLDEDGGAGAGEDSGLDEDGDAGAGEDSGLGEDGDAGAGEDGGEDAQGQAEPDLAAAGDDSSGSAGAASVVPESDAAANDDDGAENPEPSDGEPAALDN